MEKHYAGAFIEAHRDFFFGIDGVRRYCEWLALYKIMVQNPPRILNECSFVYIAIYLMYTTLPSII